MHHVGLLIDNLCVKSHQVLIRNKTVLGPYVKNMNCLLENIKFRTQSLRNARLAVGYKAQFAGKTSFSSARRLIGRS